MLLFSLYPCWPLFFQVWNLGHFSFKYEISEQYKQKFEVSQAISKGLTWSLILIFITDICIIIFSQMIRNFVQYFFLLHCKGHLNSQHNFFDFSRIFVTLFLVKIFNIIRYANDTTCSLRCRRYWVSVMEHWNPIASAPQAAQRVTSHCIMSVHDIAYFIAYNNGK